MAARPALLDVLQMHQAAPDVFDPPDTAELGPGDLITVCRATKDGHFEAFWILLLVVTPKILQGSVRTYLAKDHGELPFGTRITFERRHIMGIQQSPQ